MNKPPFYITTTLPYVNADPHIGFAMEIIRADIIARYKALRGHEVFFNTGTDEHGVKIYRKALEEKVTPKEYVDSYAEKFKNLLPALGIGEVVAHSPASAGEPSAYAGAGITRSFIRTTDAKHIAAAQEFWRRCEKAGDIYKKNYKIKYCVGCELEKTESELVDGRCPLHPSLQLEIIDEENYFFKFSKYGPKLLDLYAKNPDFVIPDSRFGEIKAFVSRGLEDFSISRLASKMPWGVPVPGDESHVMYVWFDALVSYISAIGWPGAGAAGKDAEAIGVKDSKDGATFKKWWNESGGAVQYCGKDNLRQQSAMWQAMLMSAHQNSPELTPSKTIVINGFITSGGKKMSKSEGNVVDPMAVVNEYGAEALRYYVARELHPFEDSDFTMEKFKDAYNSHLANGLGNLTSRIMKMAETHLTGPVSVPANTVPENFKDALDRFDIQSASNIIWEHVGVLDATIQSTEPFKLVKVDKEKAVKIIEDLAVKLYTIGRMLHPIMPETSKTIRELVSANKSPAAPIFLRK